jgi:short-subunit dehydrogenase
MSAKIVVITGASSGIGAATAKRLRDRAIDGVGHVDGWLNNAGRGINRNRTCEHYSRQHRRSAESTHISNPHDHD